jgi:hypothetical protein
MDEQDEDLYSELAERLDEYEAFTDFTDRPVSSFVSDVCKALKLKFKWDRFEYDPWAAEEAKADPPASPFAEWWHAVRGTPGDLLLARRTSAATATARHGRRNRSLVVIPAHGSRLRRARGQAPSGSQNRE